MKNNRIILIDLFQTVFFFFKTNSQRVGQIGYFLQKDCQHKIRKWDIIININEAFDYDFKRASKYLMYLTRENLAFTFTYVLVWVLFSDEVV